MLSMYRRSRSPRSANVRSRIPSSSSARASSCSSERWASGLSGLSVGEVWAIGFMTGLSWSECDLDRPFGGVDAGADHLTGAAVDVARAEVADLARAEPPDAGVADAHPAAEGKRGAGPLAGGEDRQTAVALGLDVASQEADRAARPLAGVAADDRLEALHVEQVQVSLALPVLADRVEHRPGSGNVGRALAPVGAEGVELGRSDSTSLAGHVQLEVESLVRFVDLPQPFGEDHVIRGPRRMDVDDVADRVAVVQIADHAHDRRDAAAGADEEQLLRRLVGKHEGPFDAAQAHEIPGPGPAGQVRRDDAGVDQLRRDADAAVGPARLRGQRVGAP